jgi:hypothetical protein
MCVQAKQYDRALLEIFDFLPADRDANLRTLALGGTVILASLWVNGLGRRMGRLRAG